MIDMDRIERILARCILRACFPRNFDFEDDTRWNHVRDRACDAIDRLADRELDRAMKRGEC